MTPPALWEVKKSMAIKHKRQMKNNYAKITSQFHKRRVLFGIKYCIDESYLNSKG